METVGLTVNGADGQGLGYFEGDDDRLRLTPRHWAYLRVSEGCNQRVRVLHDPVDPRQDALEAGRRRSSSEARALMADGAFELNLIGQDTTSFGYDIGYDGGSGGARRHADASSTRWRHRTAAAGCASCTPTRRTSPTR